MSVNDKQLFVFDSDFRYSFQNNKMCQEVATRNNFEKIFCNNNNSDFIARKRNTV